MQLAQENQSTNRCILYIDDVENQLSFKALFRRKFPIFTVGRLSEAKEITMKQPVCMILSNQQAAIQPTIDFLQWVKQFDSSIIRIFIYGNDFDPVPDDILTPYKDLAHQSLWKPWSTAEMEALLLKWWKP